MKTVNLNNGVEMLILGYGIYDINSFKKISMQVFVVVPPSSMPPLSLLTRKNLSGSNTKLSSMKYSNTVSTNANIPP